MTNLVKRRTAAKGWLTRHSMRIREVLEKGTFTLIELQYEIECFDDKLSKLNLIQEEVEDNLTDEELADDIEETAKFIDNCRIYRIKAAEKVDELSNAIKFDDENSSVSSSRSKTSTKV